MTFTMPSDTELDLAAALIRRGGIVAFPTETVYGLGADAFNETAVARVFQAKNRPGFDPLIVHVADTDQTGPLCGELEGAARELANRFWPGPLTLVLPKNPAVPDIVTAGLVTVAVRMPAHPAARELIARARTPIAAPSANPFGYLSPTTAGHVRAQLAGLVDMVLDGGECEVGVESTIVALGPSGASLLRPGGVPAEEIERITGPFVPPGDDRGAPPAPGMLKKHYSPRVRVRIADSPADIDPTRADAAFLLFRTPDRPFPPDRTEVLSPSGDLVAAAARLFTALHRLEKLPVKTIIAERVPETGLGRAIMDRLTRAAARP